MGTYFVDIQKIIVSVPQTVKVSAETKEEAEDFARACAGALNWDLQETIATLNVEKKE